MLRPVACASVHAARRGQGWQMDVAKSTCTTDSPLASLAGCHPTLNWETSSAPGVCARRARQACAPAHWDRCELAPSGHSHASGECAGCVWRCCSPRPPTGASAADQTAPAGPSWSELVLDRVERLGILFQRRSGVHVGDAMWPLVVTPWGHRDFVAHPLQTPLAPVCACMRPYAAVAHIAVVGRAQPLAHRWAFLRRETTRVRRRA